MKRFSCFVAALLATLFLSVPAQANIFETAGHYYVKFLGVEYAYEGSHTDFMSGGVSPFSGDALLGPGHTLTTGFSMTAILGITDTYRTTAGWPLGDHDTVYTEKSKGLYFAVMHDLYAAASTGGTGNLTSPGTIFFTGGAVDWYYSEGGALSDLRSLRYEEGVGMVYADGTPFDLSTYGDPFATFEFAESLLHDGKPYTGYATVSEKGGALTGEATFYANTPDGSLFDSDAVSGLYDLMFQATLRWNGTSFEVNDPARVAVPTPEPASFALMGIGLLLAGIYARRRFR